jgi:hypothetical protein
MLKESFEEALMESGNSGALELRRVAPHELVLYDLSYPLDDSRCVVAHLSETEEDLIEVVWVRGTNLPSVYLAASEVIEDLVRHREAGERSRRPEEIPHLPPFSERSHRPQAV